MSDLGFRIEASAKAFEILASNLYSDKVAAVIRELSCNAADAHAEAGIPEVPFEVLLPHPQYHPDGFAIRDFGNGLRPDQIEDVFTVFFSSTKVGSKAYTGAFGLGCKSPFAISDNFFVNSYVDGKKFSYHCHRNNGYPAIKFIDSTPTNEKSGLEIIIPMKHYDQREWANKAYKIYEHFKVRPKVNIHMKYFSDSSDYIGEDNWENTEDKGAYVIMSNVRYQLDTTKLNNQLVSKNAAYNNRGIAYHIPSRSVEVTPSREGLSYTKETIDFLNLHINSIHQKFKDNLQKQIETQPSMLLAQIEFSKIKRKYFTEYFNDEKFICPMMYFWNGRPLSMNKYINAMIYHHVNTTIGYIYKINKHSANLKKNLDTNSDLPFSLEGNLNSIYFLVNDTKASQETIKAWANKKFKMSNAQSITFLIVQPEYEHILTVSNKIPSSFIAKCSNLNLVKLSKVSSGRTTIASKNMKMYVFDFLDWKYFLDSEVSNKDVISEAVDENKEVLYIESISLSSHFTNSIIVDNSCSNIYLSQIIDDINSFWKISSFLGDGFSNKFKQSKFLVLKLTKKNRAFMKRYSKENKVKFVPLISWFKSKLENELSQNQNFAQYLANRFFYSHLIASDYHLYDEMCNLFDDNFVNNMIKFSQEIDEWEKYRDKCPMINSICEYFDKYKIGKTEENNCWKYLQKKLFNDSCEGFYKFIKSNASYSYDITNLMRTFWDKNKLAFISDEEKNNKIIEYCVTGKIS